MKYRLYRYEIFALQKLMGCAAFLKYPPVTASPRHPPLGKEGKARFLFEFVGAV
ncbi:MAG: hypothetical protein J6K64_03870 [Clostridia bacterium]|nr:hypothetical protein [Clostridia bacterium]